LEDKKMSERKHILVVDDERDLADLLVFQLQKAGFTAAAVYDGRAALRSIAERRPDLVVLDLMLPELPGTDVASRIRTSPATTNLPIVMLTAKADEIDQLLGLTVGADDYITKPFSTKLLIARIEAVLRRAQGSPGADESLHLGPVEIDPRTHQARVDGRTISLTLTEFRLLLALVQADGRVLSRATLMSRAMGPGITVTERTIDVHMTSIRRKLGSAGRILRTVRGVGYRATLEPETVEA
jgi:two-component system phosphate regulon response regulator PhoB